MAKNYKDLMRKIEKDAGDLISESVGDSTVMDTAISLSSDPDMVRTSLHTMSSMSSLSTLMRFGSDEIRSLITDASGKIPEQKTDAGYPEIIVTLRSIPENDEAAMERSDSGDELVVTGVRNAHVLLKAMESGETEFPVAVTFDGPQSIYGNGFWALTSQEDLPSEFRGLDGKSCVEMQAPAVSTEALNMSPEDARLFHNAVDGILSAKTLTPVMSISEIGDITHKWAIRQDESGIPLDSMTTGEMMDAAMRQACRYQEKQKAMDVLMSI